jgi:putative peptide zinc metalloprotease protein
MPESPNTPATLASRLSGAVVSVNTDLEVSRHVFRDGPAYVIRDSVASGTHRLSPQEYAILSALEESTTLGDSYEHLVSCSVVDDEDEEAFYEFVLDLHRRGLLILPINDADRLFQRFENRRRMQRRARIAGFLFLRVPLINPDRFLTRTISLARWAFTAPALVAWFLLMLAAGAIVVAKFDDITAPILTMVSGSNLILLWFTLIGLKVIHEFGHAYACKSFGGHVPEMGAFFILFTPCAYVDATDSWRFPSVRQRAVVTLGGLYFESIVGALAVLVWAFTSPSAINTIAYQIIILSTVVTLGFNLNPLMRYDAYYLASDLWGIPNLRARARGVLVRVAKRLVFGVVEPGATESSRGLTVSLGAFGSAQLVYRATILLSIAAILILKFGLIGVALAMLFVGMSIGKAGLDLTRYVGASAEMAGRRVRGVVTIAATAALVVWGFGMVPISPPVKASGVAMREVSIVVRAKSAGFVEAVRSRVGDVVEDGELLIEMTNAELAAQAADSAAERDLAWAKRQVGIGAGPTESASRQAEFERLAHRSQNLSAQYHEVNVYSPIAGCVAAVAPTAPGVYVDAGDPLVTVGRGRREVACLVGQEQMKLLRIGVGDQVVVRSANDPMIDIPAVVKHIDEAGKRTIRYSQLSAFEGGPIPVDVASGQASEPLFEVRLVLVGATAVADGELLRVLLPTKSRTLSQITYHRIALFFNRLREAGATS